MAARRPAAVVALVLVTGAGMATIPGASAQTAAQQQFSGYSTGTVVHADALQADVAGPRLVDGEIAFSGASSNSQGLATSIINEMSQAVQPRLTDKSSYGRGAGIEVGLGTTTPNDPNANQLILGGLAEASAPENGKAVSTLVTKEVGPVPANPVAYASLLRGQAQAVWDPNTCVIGQPLAYGLGYAADAQLLNAAGDANQDGSLKEPVVATSATQNARAVSQSKSFTYLKPNGDGTWGLVSETRQTIAPVTLMKGTPGEVTIEALGEWVLRATATGKTGGATVHYGPGSVTPSTPILRIVQPNAEEPVTQILSFQDVFDGTGLVIPANPLVNIAVGEDPRAISDPGAIPDPAKAPTIAGNGTSAAAAVDVVRINLLQPDATGGLHALDLRIGHMESKVTVPLGGIRCNLPVSKTSSPEVVNPGQTFTWTISIPSSIEAFAAIACDLIAIRAVDTVRPLEGSPKWTLTGASDGGVISGNNRVEWANLGDQKKGEPPRTVTITGRVDDDSGAGIIENKVDVTATLGNCTGGAAGQDIVGQITQITGTAQTTAGAVGEITGTATVQAPQVQLINVLAGEELPKTGTDVPVAVALAAVLLAGVAWGLKRYALWLPPRA